MERDIEIFGGKSFQDLTEDIYNNAKLKKTQIDLLIQEAHSHIKSSGDIVVVLPIIKEMMEVAIKNDEHLVKLASVIQRIITKSQTSGDDDGGLLSDKEKEELMSTLRETANEIQNEQDKVENLEEKTKGFMES